MTVPPLHLADTKCHLAEWQRRKAALMDFVAELEDGRTITVGVACPPDKLASARGVYLARFAHPDAMRKAVLPKIVHARFEKNGAVLASYNDPEAAR
jgi:hypothetical protein